MRFFIIQLDSHSHLLWVFRGKNMTFGHFQEFSAIGTYTGYLLLSSQKMVHSRSAEWMSWDMPCIPSHLQVKLQQKHEIKIM